MMQRIACTTVLFCTLSVSAAATASDGKWQWAVAPYLWAADIDVSVKDQGTDVGGVQASFKDLVDKTEAGFSGLAEGGPEGSKWRVFTDVTYFEIADDDTVDGIDVDLDTDALFLDVGGVYSPAGIGKGIHILGGVRHMNIDTRIKITEPGDPSVSISQEDSYTDALLGARYRFKLSDKWSLKLRADTSTGDTEYTWTVEGLFGYRIGKNKDKQLLFGYRHRELEIDEDGLEQKIEMSGPIFAARFDF